jgi:hypothetical protein
LSRDGTAEVVGAAARKFQIQNINTYGVKTIFRKERKEDDNKFIQSASFATKASPITRWKCTTMQKNGLNFIHDELKGKW